MNTYIGRIAKALAYVFLVASFGCSTFRVVNPKPSDPVAEVNGWGRDPSDHIFVILTFSKPVDQSTVISGRTIYLETDLDNHAGGNLLWTTSKTLKFTTTKKLAELLSPHPDSVFKLKLIGNDGGNGVIKDKRGRTLDGDYDGKSGGDYTMVFTLIG